MKLHKIINEAKLEKEKFTDPDDMRMYEQRPIPMDTPNEFWYMDYKKWAYKNRGKYKKEILSLGDNTSKIFNSISSWWLAWANKKNKAATHIKDKQKFGRALALMMKKHIKIGYVMIRATPIMEILTGIIIAGFIYYTGLMVSTGEIEINNFFSFLTAMMLSYQPIRSLATINMLFYQGAAAAQRVFGVIDKEVNIKDKKNTPSF